MGDLISRRAAIDAIERTYVSMAYHEDGFTRADAMNIIKSLPSAQKTSCNGCKWDDAFGYGECVRCSRAYEDRYEVD